MNMTAAAAAALAAAVPVAHQHAMDPTPSPLGGMSPMSGGDMSSMHMSHGGSAHSRSLPVMSVVTWALATPVQFWCGMRFFRGAFRAMRAGVANMDVLVAVGTGAAYGYSALVVLLRALISSASAGAIGDPMFDTPAMLIAFVLLGKWLESVAKGKTQFALRALSDLQPRTATIVSADLSGEREIPAALLQLGDLVRFIVNGHSRRGEMSAALRRCALSVVSSCAELTQFQARELTRSQIPHPLSLIRYHFRR